MKIAITALTVVIALSLGYAVGYKQGGAHRFQLIPETVSLVLDTRSGLICRPVAKVTISDEPNGHIPSCTDVQ